MIRLVTISLFILCARLFAADEAARVYSNLERHLRSLSSLELEYSVTGGEFGDSPIAGRMVWVKPDRFFHDTPEWAFCERDGEQWRFLKAQNTLIIEAAEDREWDPERMLLNLGRDLSATGVEIGQDGRTLLTLSSSDIAGPSGLVLEFPAGGKTPDAIHFNQADGAPVRYEITRWNEQPDELQSLFVPPQVPAENLIDFRVAAPGR